MIKHLSRFVFSLAATKMGTKILFPLFFVCVCSCVFLFVFVGCWKQTKVNHNSNINLGICCLHSDQFNHIICFTWLETIYPMFLSLFFFVLFLLNHFQMSLSIFTEFNGLPLTFFSSVSFVLIIIFVAVFFFFWLWRHLIFAMKFYEQNSQFIANA